VAARGVRTVAADGALRDHPYSSVRTADGGLGWVSGVLPYDRDGSVVLERDAALTAALRVLAERVTAAGATLADVVKVTAYLVDLGWRDALNEAWLATFEEPRPARTAVEVRALPRGAPIELDAVIHVAREA
jgi:2-iminobutanoate/2-iminopropanoate deaminase